MRDGVAMRGGVAVIMMLLLLLLLLPYDGFCNGRNSGYVSCATGHASCVSVCVDVTAGICNATSDAAVSCACADGNSVGDTCDDDMAAPRGETCVADMAALSGDTCDDVMAVDSGETCDAVIAAVSGDTCVAVMAAVNGDTTRCDVLCGDASDSRRVDDVWERMRNESERFGVVIGVVDVEKRTGSSVCVMAWTWVQDKCMCMHV